MKKNKTLYHLLGHSVTVTKNPRPDAVPGMRTKLAQAVHWYTSFQMSINHCHCKDWLTRIRWWSFIALRTWREILKSQF
jgi:hypothetical protein